MSKLTAFRLSDDLQAPFAAYILAHGLTVSKALNLAVACLVHNAKPDIATLSATEDEPDLTPFEALGHHGPKDRDRKPAKADPNAGRRIRGYDVITGEPFYGD